METQLLQEFGIAGGRPLPPGRPADAHSPQTLVALQSLYASMDDNTNKCESHRTRMFSLVSPIQRSTWKCGPNCDMACPA